MRHAKSSWSEPSLRDHDRPLNKRGRRAATAIGGWLKAGGYAVDQALVSNARRTQETWARVVEVTGAAPTRYMSQLYAAGEEAMLAALRGAPDGASSVLMLGHQPGIGAFARRLLAAPPADAGFEKYPSGATAVIDFEIDAWANAGWGGGRLVDFVVPRALE